MAFFRTLFRIHKIVTGFSKKSLDIFGILDII